MKKKTDKITPEDIRDMIMETAPVVLELHLTMMTGKDTFGVLQDLDIPPSAKLVGAAFKELAAIAKTAVPKPVMSDRYSSTSDKQTAERIIQDVYDGEIDVEYARSMMALLRDKINAIELLHLNKQLTIAGEHTGEGAMVVKLLNTKINSADIH